MSEVKFPLAAGTECSEKVTHSSSSMGSGEVERLSPTLVDFIGSRRAGCLFAGVGLKTKNSYPVSGAEQAILIAFFFFLWCLSSCWPEGMGFEFNRTVK